MKVVLLLGKNSEYLTYKKFQTDSEVDSFLEEIQPLMLANIDGEFTLKKRLESLEGTSTKYFPFAGAVMGFEVLDLSND
jgi:hypothetical protein